MSDENVLCPICRHPTRQHDWSGCTRTGCWCELTAPIDAEPTQPAPELAPEPEAPTEVAEPQPDPVEVIVEPLEPAPAGDKLAELLAKAERSGSARMYKQAEKVREAVALLEGMVSAYEKRAEAERAVAKLRKELAEAEAKLRNIGPAYGPTKAAQSGNKSEHLREIRQWAWANNIECSKQGRIPVPVMDAYRAAHRGVAA